MKLQYAVVSILLASLLLLAGINLADAQWNALGTGYAVTTNWHGEDVPIGMSVLAIAGTTDIQVEYVNITWLDPDGNPIWEDKVAVFGPYETPDYPAGVPEEIIDWASDNPGINVWYANATRIPYALGDWGVQARFIDYTNPVRSLRGRNTDIIKMRATSFNVVPEVPFGTIAILLGWFGVLGIFALRKKHFHEPTPV
jgi:hypothetical protein